MFAVTKGMSDLIRARFHGEGRHEQNLLAGELLVDFLEAFHLGLELFGLGRLRDDEHHGLAAHAFQGLGFADAGKREIGREADDLGSGGGNGEEE